MASTRSQHMKSAFAASSLELMRGPTNVSEYPTEASTQSRCDGSTSLTVTSMFGGGARGGGGGEGGGGEGGGGEG